MPLIFFYQIKPSESSTGQYHRLTPKNPQPHHQANEFINFLADNDIDDDDRKYVENYLSIVNEISNQYETKYFEENGVHTEAYWFDYLKELITEE